MELRLFTVMVIFCYLLGKTAADGFTIKVTSYREEWVVLAIAISMGMWHWLPVQCSKRMRFDLSTPEKWWKKEEWYPVPGNQNWRAWTNNAACGKGQQQFCHVSPTGLHNWRKMLSQCRVRLNRKQVLSQTEPLVCRPCSRRMVEQNTRQLNGTSPYNQCVVLVVSRHYLVNHLCFALQPLWSYRIMAVKNYDHLTVVQLITWTTG